MPQAGTWPLGSAWSHTCHRCERGAGAGEDQHQTRIDRRAERPRILDERDQEHDADRDHGNALEDAQRTGLEAQSVLQP